MDEPATEEGEYGHGWDMFPRHEEREEALKRETEQPGPEPTRQPAEPKPEPPLAADDPPGRHTALAIMSVSVVLSLSTWFSATAVLSELRPVWGVSETTASLLIVAVQLGFVAGATASASRQLADRVNARRLVFYGSSLAAAANALLLAAGATADGFALAVFARFLTGCGLALVYPPAMVVVSQWFARGRGFALGVMIGALTLGSASPHLLVALGGGTWRATVAATSALALVGGAVALAAGDGPIRRPTPAVDLRRALRAARQPGPMLATLAYVGHQVELYSFWGLLNAYYEQVLEDHTAMDAGERERRAALVTFVAISAGAAGSVAGGVLADRLGRTLVAGAALAVSASCGAAIGGAAELAGGSAPAVVAAVAVLWGLAVIPDSAQFSTMVTETAERDLVGSALSFQLAVGYLATIPTLYLVPLVAGREGWAVAWLLLVPGPLAGLAALWRMRSLPDVVAKLAGGRG